MQITFKRERDLRGAQRRYAWQVLVDGDLRGYIVPSGTSYALADKERKYVRRPKGDGPGGKYPVMITGPSVDRLKALAIDAARGGLLPTDQQLVDRAAAQIEREKERERLQAIEDAEYRQQQAGPQLFKALVALNLNRNRPTRGTNDRAWRLLVQQAHDAIRAAGGTVE